jgi:ubiquinone/menaquinone biosynthesis C-methylase UbiE
MTSIAERYDYSAGRYERWWAPVLSPTALGLLERLAPDLDARPDAHVLDIGTGSGTLAVGILERWPGVTLVGVDASAGMLDVARDGADQRLGAGSRRLSLRRANADELPFDEGSCDVVVSSFVFQLLPDRRAALLEARRVLRSGGLLATVTWLVDDRRFEPDEAFEDALDDLAIDIPEDDEEPRGGNYTSPTAAAGQTRKAGFRNVQAIADELVHRYDPAEYLEFLEQYAERGLFEALEPGDRARLRDVTAARLGRLPAADFVWRARVVTLLARRP